MEQVDTTGNKEEYCSNNQGNKVKENQEEEVINCCPKIINWLILPVAILHIPKNTRVWTVERSNETDKIGKRNDDFKTLTDDKNLYTLHEFLNIVFCRIPFGFEGNDNKVEVDKKVNTKKDVDSKICCLSTNTHRKKNCVVGDGFDIVIVIYIF